jgi:hypothetical protein
MKRITAQRRAPQVCQLCHQRKIRCEVRVKGFPCLKCTETGDRCELRPRKAYSARKKKATPQTVRTGSESASADGGELSDNDRTSNTFSTIEDSNRSDMIVKNIVSHDNSSNKPATLYVGDQYGIAALLETNQPSTVGKKHFLVPSAATQVLEPEDLHYLKVKGCFSLPEVDVCASLIQCYFEFVHLNFPILDAKLFLDAYTEAGIQAINLLLLWSMFSVAASVCLS